MASGVIAGFAARPLPVEAPPRRRERKEKRKKEARRRRDAFAEFPPARRAPEFAAGPQDPASVERAALVFAPVFRGVPGNIIISRPGLRRGSAPARRAGARDGGGDGAGLRAARLRSRSGSTAPPTVPGVVRHYITRGRDNTERRRAPPFLFFLSTNPRLRKTNEILSWSNIEIRPRQKFSPAN